MVPQQDVSNLSVIELKALAFDAISQLELIKQNLMILEKQIQLKLQEEKKVEV